MITSSFKSDAPRVFQYWHTRTLPPYLRLCHRSVRDNHRWVTLLDYNDYRDLLSDLRLPLPITNGEPEIDANILRALLLAKYGGIWLDTDILCFKSFEPVYNKAFIPSATTLPLVDFLAVTHSGIGIDNNVMLAKPGSEIMSNYWEAVGKKVAIGAIRSKGQVNASLLKEFVPSPMNLLPHGIYAFGPITFDWLKEEPFDFSSIHAAHLLNSANKDILASKDEEWFLGPGKTMIQQAMKLALK